MKLFSLVFLLAPLTAGAFSIQDLTPNSPCGARGVGWDGVKSAGNHRIVEKHQPGLRVSPTGWWVACAMPPACPEKKISPWDSLNGRGRCGPGISSIRPGKLGDFRTVIDAQWKGQQRWLCTPDGWRLVKAYCNP